MLDRSAVFFTLRIKFWWQLRTSIAECSGHYNYKSLQLLDMQFSFFVNMFIGYILLLAKY